MENISMENNDDKVRPLLFGMGYSLEEIASHDEDLYFDQVVTRILSAPSTLVLDASAQMAAQIFGSGSIAIFGAVHPLVLSSMQQHPQYREQFSDYDIFAARPVVRRGQGVLVQINGSAPHTDLQQSVVENAIPEGSLVGAVGNVVFGSSDDELLLQSIRKSLQKQAPFVCTTLLNGSFDEMFDILLEVFEQEERESLVGALRAARSRLPKEAEIVEKLVRSGLRKPSFTIEERSLFWASGAQALADPLVRDVLFPLWFSHRSALSPSLVEAAEAMIDTYFAGIPFVVRIRTGVFTAYAPA